MENSKVFLNRKIQTDPFYMSPVEIVIPFYGEHFRVSKLMESIFNTVHTNRYLITLVDDGSLNKSFVKSIENKKILGVRCFQQEQKGFGAAINLALKNPHIVNIPWVLIMHSDVFAEDSNWLSGLGKTLNVLKEGGVKMVSPMTNNPGVDSTFFVGKKGVKSSDHILTEGFLPMYCALAHRELYNKVGFFKECPYAGIEVEDFAIRMNQFGFKQAISGSSWVNHIGGATLNKLKEDRKIQEILRKSREEFDSNLQNEVHITK
jgi:glycosyltransferase involved in cell wall biosynthesis